MIQKVFNKGQMVLNKEAAYQKSQVRESLNEVLTYAGATLCLAVLKLG